MQDALSRDVGRINVLQCSTLHVVFRKRGYGADDRALACFDCGARRPKVNLISCAFHCRPRAGKAATADEPGHRVCPSDFPVPRGAQRSQCQPSVFRLKRPAQAMRAPGRGLAGELGRGDGSPGIVNYIPSRELGQETVAKYPHVPQRGFSTRTRNS